MQVTDFVKDVNSNLVPIIPSVTTMENSFDVKIKTGDYSLVSCWNFIYIISFMERY